MNRVSKIPEPRPRRKVKLHKNMTERELRLEFNKPSFKKMLRDALGCNCVNCGSDYEVQYHHIVPLALGGTNRITNIVPLCYSCHRASHHGQHMSHYKRHSENTGRPQKISYEDAEPILEQFFDGQIGTSECIELLGYKKTVHIADLKHTKEYMKRHRIRSYRNNVDIRKKKGCLKRGICVGYIYYEDGEYRELIY